MTEPLFIEDSYLSETHGTVVDLTQEGGIILDRTIFYAKGGGQPGDSGRLRWQGNEMAIAATLKGEGNQIVLVPAEPVRLPDPGTRVEQVLDWERRHHLMRMHTALHLLSVVIPLPVTGGAIGETKSRLDFDMPDAPEDREAIQDLLNLAIDRDLAITQSWITDEELAANPGLVKTMSVKPPTGAGRVRLIRIGEGSNQIDLQPCGGTHVARTGEIGQVTLGKIEKKGRQNRRVHLHLDD